MIQDIGPDRLDNAYRTPETTPGDIIMHFENDRLLASFGAGNLLFPKRREYPDGAPGPYLFSVSGRPYFLYRGSGAAPEGYTRYSMQELRQLALTGNSEIFAAFTAYHLWKWYITSRFCGACGAETAPDKAERAMVCQCCGNRIYPRLNPAVIVGVRNGDRLLITRYKKGYGHNALVAGFTEIGETVEETVRREVMEETGIRVKNIHYHASQPWGVAGDILMGFYCDADGDDTILRDDSELKYAKWVKRDEIVLQPNDYSLTNEMMKLFRDGKA